MFAIGSEIAAKQVGEGFSRKVLAHDDELMVCEMTFEKGAVVPGHAHPHKQCSYIAAGRALFTVGEETRELCAGDSALIPSDVFHAVEMLEPCVIIDVFTPARKDFLE